MPNADAMLGQLPKYSSTIRVYLTNIISKQILFLQFTILCAVFLYEPFSFFPCGNGGPSRTRAGGGPVAACLGSSGAQQPILPSLSVIPRHETARSVACLLLYLFIYCSSVVTAHFYFVIDWLIDNQMWEPAISMSFKQKSGTPNYSYIFNVFQIVNIYSIPSYFICVQ